MYLHIYLLGFLCSRLSSQDSVLYLVSLALRPVSLPLRRPGREVSEDPIRVGDGKNTKTSVVRIRSPRLPLYFVAHCPGRRVTWDVPAVEKRRGLFVEKDVSRWV